MNVLQVKVGMGTNLKLFPFPQFSSINARSEVGLCNIRLPLGPWNLKSTLHTKSLAIRSHTQHSQTDFNSISNAFQAPRYEQSSPSNKSQVNHTSTMTDFQGRSKDSRAGETHKAQPSALDMFLQGNATYNIPNKSDANNLTQAGWNGKVNEEKPSELDESTRMDECSGEVSRIKYQNNYKGSELRQEGAMPQDGYLDRKTEAQFNNRSKQNRMGLGEDDFQERATYDKAGANGKQSSESDFVDLSKHSSVVQESVGNGESYIGKKLSEGGTQLPQKNFIVNSDKEVKSRKQLVTRSSVIAKQVISKTSALSMGFVSQLWVDTSSWIVQMVEIRPSLLSGEMDRFFLKDLCQVGDVILVEDESVLENELTMIGLDTLVGYNIITEERHSLGKIRDYKFNINLGNVAYLEFDSIGVPFIPPSVVSTYCLLVEDVIEVTSDTMVVRAGGDVQVQRLTKGLWEASNPLNDVKLRKSTPNNNDYGGQISPHDEFERRFNLLSKKYYPNKGMDKQSFLKESHVKDEWGLPLDYS